jgi:hypothetical protein
MARKRYIKPSFFKNEDLAALPPLVRILFTGLWCYADREGRLEDRPMRLKCDIIPYDNFSVDKGLDRLQKSGFIIRYVTIVNNKEFKAIQIISFKKHQDVHVNEQTSTIPAPDLHGANTVQAQDKNSANTPLNLELNTLSTLNLTVVEEVVVTREEIFEQAVQDFFEPPPEEKEKSSEQKEKDVPSQPVPVVKPFPTTDEVLAKVSQTAYWRNVSEHHKIPETDRPELFKRFYEQKEDNYKIQYPTIAHYTTTGTTEVAKNFYFWVPIHLKTSVIQQLNNHATTKAQSLSNAAGSRNERNNGIADIIAKSEDFLHQYHD